MIVRRLSADGRIMPQRSMQMDFSEDEIRRYARHILLDEVGGAGQARLRAARVLIVGVGGLGSPLALYLAAAGIGTIGLADDDRVELSNLQRQIAHGTSSIGLTKTQSARAAMAALNPAVAIVAHECRVGAANAPEIVSAYDIVCDGTDNFESRFAVADACYQTGRTLVSAAVLRFEGQLATFRRGQDLPCYRCLYPAPPPPGLVPSCAEAGVLGTVTGVMGTLQATEVMKEILGIGETLAGRLLIWDALAMRFRVVRLRRDPACPLCGAGISDSAV
jgi:molybdopterin/thiamine biosynthesis adenylyltransferase